MLDVQTMSLEFTYNTPILGSSAEPPHSAPPSKPGKITVDLPTMNGVNCPSLWKVLNWSSAHWWTSGVRLVSMSSVNRCLAKGAGFKGKGWVRDVTSPSTVLAGTRRYSIG